MVRPDQRVTLKVSFVEDIVRTTKCSYCPKCYENGKVTHSKDLAPMKVQVGTDVQKCSGCKIYSDGSMIAYRLSPVLSYTKYK
jgi:hypothetical protein